MTANEKRRFWILVSIVSISGFSQGMLLPLISVIFEMDGVSSALNGLNATGLYIGTILITPFMEIPLRKFGYKPVILIGGAIVISSLLVFPLWKSVLFWYILRLLIGIGDHALHFSTQTWITSFSSKERLGRNIALYGLSFGLGFAIGPLFVPLVNVFEGLPFIVSGLLCLLAWTFVFFLDNEHPGHMHESSTMKGTMQRFKASFLIAGFAFLPPFSYGFLESSLHAIFPVYALRAGIDVTSVSIILASFSVGGIVSQLPLGILSDRIGRKAIILVALFGGAASFSGAAFLEASLTAVISFFFIAGLFVGSTFSLGISYMTDLTPRNLLPTGNLLCGVFFSIGSLTGPFFGGVFLEWSGGISYMWLVSSLLLLIGLISLLGKTKPASETY
ncbi:MFS transporter [Paenisporosarcina cavernae]|uniref:MFS transporter n=1 Tax=Paenisporosarcina cavernae TaxID=2320858 RepID=A0A385YVD1_9BACL|nr:MFS transporter [Paenisporosarcina cavernae]AYC30240.1 MFS transporter [Paenisporosarcina cavernae]